MRDPGFGVVTQISHIWHSRHDYGRTYGQPDRKLTVSRPLQTPLRPELYKLSSASSAWEETKELMGHQWTGHNVQQSVFQRTHGRPLKTCEPN